MKIGFMGTPEFAKIILKIMTDRGYKPDFVVTQPDKTSGRGRKINISPVKQFALEQEIKILQPEKARKKSFRMEIEELNPDLLVVAAYGQILSGKLLNTPRLGGVNVHASILPDYRGSSPIQRVILDGKNITGVTLMQMNEEIDCGDIIDISKVNIEKTDDAETLETKLAISGGTLLCDALDRGIETLPRERQDLSMGKYYSKIAKDEGWIDFSRSAEEIFNQIRGLYPWPTAFCEFRGKLLKIIQSEVSDELIPGEMGEIVKVDSKNGLLVSTGSGTLKIIRVRPENKSEMNASDFARGARIQSGEKFEGRKGNSEVSG